MTMRDYELNWDDACELEMNLRAEISRLKAMNQELWEHLTPEVRHELNKKYAAPNLQSEIDHEQRTQKKGE